MNSQYISIWTFSGALFKSKNGSHCQVLKTFLKYKYVSSNTKTGCALHSSVEPHSFSHLADAFIWSNLQVTLSTHSCPAGGRKELLCFILRVNTEFKCSLNMCYFVIWGEVLSLFLMTLLHIKHWLWHERFKHCSRLLAFLLWVNVSLKCEWWSSDCTSVLLLVHLSNS